MSRDPIDQAIHDLFAAFEPSPPPEPLEHGWWRGWGCHIGPLWFCWVDSWARVKGAPWWRCYGLDVTVGQRRIVSIGSQGWRRDA